MKSVEVTIAYLDSKRSLSSGLKKTRPHLSKKIDDLGDLKKDEHFQFVSSSFEEGGALQYLFLNKNLSAYEIQTILRKNISTVLNRPEGLVVHVNKLKTEDQELCVESLATLSQLETWVAPVYGKREKNQKEKKLVLPHFKSSLNSKKLKSIVEKSVCLGEKNSLVRTLASMPPNVLNPREYKKILQKRSKDLHYSYKFLDTSALKKLGAGSMLAVMSADPNSEGGIAHLTYKPKSKTKATPVISIVGKGLCFDTGGYNVKTSHMYTMHRDMTGSAVALAVFESLAEMKAPFEVHAFLAIAENYISPTGYKPNDVVTAMDGTSIEVVDTDAEGRMVLCDTLCYSKEVKPDLILDFATLTGAAVYSIGTRRAAVFSNVSKAGEMAVDVGNQTGERCWLFPIGEDYCENIKSDVADILQCSSVRGVDHINAATFLSHFVGNTPWVHMDLSPEENKGGLGLVGTDVTGFGVRWGLKFIEKYFKRDL